MTKKEERFKRQRNKGLLISLLGFIVASLPVYIVSEFGIDLPFIIEVVGYVLGIAGLGVYWCAFLGEIKYSQSEEYARDLTAKKPWE
jgi:hypothetical protein